MPAGWPARAGCCQAWSPFTPGRFSRPEADVALEQEVQVLQNDVSGAQQLIQQMTVLAPGLAQALVLAGQFATTLTSASQQLAGLASGVNIQTVPNVVTAARQIQQQCQAALTPLAPAEQAWNSATGL